LIDLIESHAQVSKTGRPPFPLSVVLRIHFMQQWFGLSDPVSSGHERGLAWHGIEGQPVAPRDEGAREMNDLREDMDEMSYLFDDSYVVVILREAMDMIRARACGRKKQAAADH
jgi:hypothetical protein